MKHIINLCGCIQTPKNTSLTIVDYTIYGTTGGAPVTGTIDASNGGNIAVEVDADAGSTLTVEYSAQYATPGCEKDDCQKPIAGKYYTKLPCAGVYIETPVDTAVEIPTDGCCDDPKRKIIFETKPCAGTVSASGSTVTYTPQEGFEGTENFVIFVCCPDGEDIRVVVGVTVG